MGPLEQRLEQVAKARGWRLRWETEPLVAMPAYTATSLDIFRGRYVVNVSGPICIIHAGSRSPREGIAQQVLNVIARTRGHAAAGASATRG
jgi:hypothetical protein